MQVIRHPVTLGSRVPECPIKMFSYLDSLTSLLNTENSLHPGDDLMRRRVRGLVEVDDTVALELVQGALGGRPAAGQGREMVGLDIELVEVL